MARTHALVLFFDSAEDAAEFTLGLTPRGDTRMVKVDELSFNFEGCDHADD